MSLSFMGRDNLKKTWGVFLCLKQGSIFSENHINMTQETEDPWCVALQTCHDCG